MMDKNRRPDAIPFQGSPSRKLPTRAPAALTWISLGVWESFRREETNAHRLASAPAAWLERFGDDLLLSCQEESHLRHYLPEIERRCRDYDYLPRRIFGKFLPRQASERGAPSLLFGDPSLSLVTEVTEDAVRFALDFGGGYSCGLFLDQRLNRTRLHSLQPKRLLNTFAYTCSFSVVAALGGSETLSVDLSRRSLTRGEENFRLNGLDPKSNHRFMADDVFSVLPRLARRGEKYDAIILDPPTFSRNHAGHAFKAQRDFGKLVDLALAVAAPGAALLLSTNDADLRVGDLEQMGRECLRAQNRSGKLVSSLPLIDFPSGHGAKTIWLELKA